MVEEQHTFVTQPLLKCFVRKQCLILFFLPEPVLVDRHTAREVLYLGIGQSFEAIDRDATGLPNILATIAYLLEEESIGLGQARIAGSLKGGNVCLAQRWTHHDALFG